MPVAAVAAAGAKGVMMTKFETSKIGILAVQFARRQLRGFCRLALALLLVIALPVTAAEQRRFASPDEAVNALIEACQADDDAALVALFGERHQRLVVSPDRAYNTQTRAQLLAALQGFRVLADDGADRRLLLIGEQAWPLPIPLLREAGGWRFASELGEDEIINRRIGANEREAIAVLRAYLDAQRQYAALDRNGDGVLEYARRLGSTPGHHDGLYWPAPAGEEASPFGPLVAASSAYLKGHQQGDAYRGYHFRILTRQGKSAPGGAFSYLINGRMLAGFALLAYPAEYGESGVMTLIVSNNGTIYQKDLGPATARVAAEITEFNPDASWQRVGTRVETRVEDR
ncbi:MAG: hypothetical protein H6R17_1214 [Proteobacteria bacterium]|nr:hypothetical protein [Pseudomonadota bacterium]